MKDSMQNYFKTGLIHFMAYPSTIKGEGPILETVKKIAVDDYFDVIEFTWMKDPAVRKEVKKMFETSKLTAAYGSQPRMLTTGMNINDLDEEKRLAALASLKEGIDEAYEMGAVGFAFLSGKYEEATKEESYQALLKSTKELCRYAKEKGDIPVELEVFDYDVDKKSIIGPAELALRFAQDMRKEYESFGLVVDLSHLPLVRESSKHCLTVLKDYITHIHIGNAVVEEGKDAYGDAHPRFGFPNASNDVAELTEFLKVLFEIGYLGGKNRPIVSFEVKPWGDEDPDLVVANAKRTLNEAWARLEI